MVDKLRHDIIKYDIIENCNLNCRNCSHFSQFKTPTERSVEHIKDDISRLCDKVKMEQFHIFGGEPLLHSNIIGVLIVLRKVLGDKVEIRLLTNGLKIPTMSEAFFVAVKSLNVVIELTEYILKIDYAKIEEKIRSKEIPLIVRVTTEFWNFVDPSGNQNAEESFKLCSVCPHTYYEDGNVFLCAYVKSVPFVNKHFGYNIEHNYVSITSSVETIKDYLNRPCSTCRFCKASRKPETWRIHS